MRNQALLWNLRLLVIDNSLEVNGPWTTTRDMVQVCDKSLLLLDNEIVTLVSVVLCLLSFDILEQLLQVFLDLYFLLMKNGLLETLMDSSWLLLISLNESFDLRGDSRIQDSALGVGTQRIVVMVFVRGTLVGLNLMIKANLWLLVYILRVILLRIVLLGERDEVKLPLVWGVYCRRVSGKALSLTLNDLLFKLFKAKSLELLQFNHRALIPFLCFLFTCTFLSCMELFHLYLFRRLLIVLLKKLNDLLSLLRPWKTPSEDVISLVHTTLGPLLFVSDPYPLH